MALGKNRQQQTTNYNSNNQQRESYGLWINTSKDGKEYLTFTIDGVKYVAFENTKKQNDRSPDYTIYKSKDLQSKQQNNGYGYQGQNNQGYRQQNGNFNQPNQYPQNNGYQQNQGSENTTYRNENVGASEPQNPGYNPDPLDGLSL